MSRKCLLALIIIAFVVSPLLMSCGQKQEASTGKQAENTEQKSTSATQKSEAKPQAQASAPRPLKKTPSDIVGVEKQVLDTLLPLWQLRSNATSLDQAAKMVHAELTDSMRLELQKKFLADTTLSERLSRYLPYTFILSNNEKLVGLFIITYEHKNSEFPAAKQIASELKIPDAEVKSCLKSLATFKFLYDLGGPDQYNKLGYSYGPDLNNYTFDLGIHIHEFSVDGGTTFNIGCAKEAFGLVSTLYSDKKVHYHTVDPLTVAPIDVVFKNGEVESYSPDSTTFMEGGTCGTNNLFVTGANAGIWAKQQPLLLNKGTLPIYGVKEGLEEVKKQYKAAESSK